MKLLAKREKSFGIELDQAQALNAQITACEHFVSKRPGEIWCRHRKAFIQVADCKVCVVGGGP